VTGRTAYHAYHRFPLDAFKAADDEFDIRVGANRFRADPIELDIDRPEGALRGEISFSGGVPWPVTWTSPRIMGPYGLAPFMECYHGVLSFNHELEGRLAIEGATLDLHGGLLHAPQRVAMLQRVLESFTARLHVRLLAGAGGHEQLLFEGTSRHAGVEIVGPIDEVQKLAQKG
jgi:hypothetical protein